MSANSFIGGVRASLSTALGYISIGLACGVVGASSGLSPIEMGLMSVIVYGGSAQFVMCAMLYAKAPISSIVMSVFLINLRHLLMSLQATTIFKGVGLKHGILIGSLITDESYGVLLNEYAHHQSISTSWMHGNNIASYVTWVLSVFLSSIVGQYIPSPELFGLDFALVAMFVALFAAQLEALMMIEKVKKVLLILLTVLVAYVLLTLFFSESVAVLLATLSGCSVGVMYRDAK
ncbi:AzlC family ABC transporter permease [Streptococcus sp. zg-JUN1979]|uniref:AzlC family ABC transporter permease n=1 Tax=Streptococcus sp. zg-JUN1979 TaxID=3391450 RepID=UPI0039A73E03